MKKQLLSLVVAITALATEARDFTYEYEGQTVTYTVIDEDAKTCMTGRVLGVSGDLILPSHPNDGENDFTLIAIGEESFYESEINSVVIPNTVKSIHNYAFIYCWYLSSVELPESLETIGERAFALCRGLSKIEIPNSVTKIGIAAFQNCNNITSVTLPSSIDRIDYNTFLGCEKLASIEIPNSVVEIGGVAFYGCNSLTSVVIPASVNVIEGGAFSGCNSLSEIIVDPANMSYCSEKGVLFSRDKTLLVQLPGGKSEYSIPNTVLGIYESAFSYCRNLNWILIPDSVEYIDSYAFEGCENLIYIFNMSSHPQELGENVFRNIPNYVTVYVPNGSIDNYKAASEWSLLSKFCEVPIENPGSSYEAIQGPWTFSGIDFFDGSNQSFNMSLVGVNEDHEGYGQTLYLYNFGGISNFVAEVRYFYDESTDTYNLEFELGQVLGQLNFTGLGLCDVCLFGVNGNYLVDTGVITANVDTDMHTITFSPDDIFFLAVLCNGEYMGGINGYEDMSSTRKQVYVDACLSIRVLDGEMPVAGAVVAFQDKDYTSDENGVVAINDINGLKVIGCSVPFSVSVPGYETFVGEADFSETLNVNVTASLVKIQSSVTDIIVNSDCNGNIVYDMNGRRVMRPQNGQVYIINGRKVILKR